MKQTALAIGMRRIVSTRAIQWHAARCPNRRFGTRFLRQSHVASLMGGTDRPLRPSRLVPEFIPVDPRWDRPLDAVLGLWHREFEENSDPESAEKVNPQEHRRIMRVGSTKLSRDSEHRCAIQIVPAHCLGHGF